MKRDFDNVRFPITGLNNSALAGFDRIGSIRNMFEAQQRLVSAFNLPSISASRLGFDNSLYRTLSSEFNSLNSQFIEPLAKLRQSNFPSTVFDDVRNTKNTLGFFGSEAYISPLVASALDIRRVMQVPEFQRVDIFLNKELYAFSRVAIDIVGTVISQSPEKFNESSLEETFQILDVNDDISLEDLNERLDSFESRIISSIERNNRPFGLESILTIILTIFITVLTSLSDRKFQTQNHEEHVRIEREIEAIEQSQEKILDMVIGMYSEVDKNSPLYVVKRQTSVSLRPKGKSTKIAPLYPGQKVELEDSKGKWVYISYFNYLDEKTYSGWVLKKYLKTDN